VICHFARGVPIARGVQGTAKMLDSTLLTVCWRCWRHNYSRWYRRTRPFMNSSVRCINRTIKLVQ